MKWSAENRLFFIYAAFFVSLFVFAALFFRIDQTAQDAEKRVDHTHYVLFQSEKVLAANNDLQIAIRESLARSDPRSLFILDQKIKLLLSGVDKLQNLTSDNSRQQVRIKKLRDLIDQRLNLLNSFRNGEGHTQHIFDSEMVFLRSIWRAIGAIQSEENRLLSIRRDENNLSRKALNIVFYASLIVGCIVLLSTFIVSRKYIRLRQQLILSVSRENEVLEKKVEESMLEISEKEKRYHLILNNMLEGAQILDYNWRYLYANAALAKQAHYTVEQLVGSRMQDLYPGIQDTPLFKVLNRCMTERVHQKFENHFYYPNGVAAYFEVIIEPIKEGLFVLTMDITDRKIRENYKEQYISELEEVLFKISHEVRSPVVKILGVSQLLELSLIDKNEFPMVINEMKKCAVLLDKYTRDLSDFVTEMRNHSSLGTDEPGEKVSGQDS